MTSSSSGRTTSSCGSATSALACTYVRVDQATGQRDIVDLGALDLYRMRRSVVEIALARRHGAQLLRLAERRVAARPSLFDLATGTDVQVVSADQYNVETAWAADSSGMFVIVDRTIVFYDRATGEQIPVAPEVGLEDIVAVATRPITG